MENNTPTKIQVWGTVATLVMVVLAVVGMYVETKTLHAEMSASNRYMEREVDRIFAQVIPTVEEMISINKELADHEHGN